MLTVKHLHCCGQQSVFEATSVEFIPTVSDPPTSDSPTRDVVIACGRKFPGAAPGDGPAHTITSGRVYVMNEAGKTIANYDLGEPPPVSGGVDPKSRKPDPRDDRDRPPI